MYRSFERRAAAAEGVSTQCQFERLLYCSTVQMSASQSIKLSDEMQFFPTTTPLALLL